MTKNDQKMTYGLYIFISGGYEQNIYKYIYIYIYANLICDILEQIVRFRFVLWDVLPCKITVDQRFRGTCCLHHHQRPDDGGSTYLWNVGPQLFYMAGHPRRQIWTSHSLPWELEISHTRKKNYMWSKSGAW
jgi:hypothetical protein